MNSKSTKIHNHNSKCYRHELLQLCKNGDGMFDSCVDMTYLITMENSKRHKSFMNQLYKYTPASKIIIQYNKGYRKCSKKIKTQNTHHDLTDAYRNIFVHSQQNNYKKILIFEDDFIIDPNYFEQSDIAQICKFVKNNNFDVYNLGPLDALPIPFGDHNINISYSASHACIYNAPYIVEFIKAATKNKIDHCDEFWNNLKFIKYSYHKPIIFQIYEMTENKKNNWVTNNGYADYNIFNGVKRYGLDKNYENYQTVYNQDKVKSWCIALAIILAIIVVAIIIVLIIHYKK